MHDNDNTASLQRSFMELDVTHDLRRITQPVLVLYGQRDAIAAAGASKFASLPHREFVVLPRIGHEVFADAPSETLGLVTTFLNQ